MSYGVITGVVLASAALFATLILAFRRAAKYVTRITRANLPPRSLGIGYPIVGNLPSVDRRVHVTLTDLARTAGRDGGSVFRLRLGSWPAVVVSGQAAIREAFVRHGRALASRPNYRSYSNYADGKSISFQPYAAPLKLHRQLTLKAIRTIVETGSAERIVTRQAVQLIDGWIHRRRRAAFDPARSVALAVAGGLYSMCYGEDAQLSDNKAFEDVLLDANPGTEILAFGNPVDLIPWCLCTARTRNKYAEYVKRMTSLLRLNDELVTRRRCRRHRRPDDDDIVGAMLDASRDLDPTSGLTPQHLLRTAIEVMSAGSDTSSSTILWLIHYAVRHPDVQERVHAEIRREVGPERTVAYADRRRLPFTESVVLEVMRLRSIVPFALPHYSTEDVRLAGDCTIPRHSLVFMNLWSVGRDRGVWGEDVDDFRPERFLIAGDGPDGGHVLSVDATKANMFYPFGVGRRRCVGETLGRMQVFLFFVNVVQRFLLKSGEGLLTDEEEFGDILKPKPYSIVVEDRRLL